jgi:hypothetical protein
MNYALSEATAVTCAIATVVAEVIVRACSRRRRGYRPRKADSRATPVLVVTRSELGTLDGWSCAFSGQRKDRRYYEIVDDTICPEFDFRYFALRDAAGAVRAVQPFFLLDQDLVAGAGRAVRSTVEFVRRRFFRKFLMMRTLMVGCAAGEGHLDGAEHEELALHWAAGRLHDALTDYARSVKARLVVLKEFPARYRRALSCFSDNGYTRVPSLPMTRLNINYPSFDDYMTTALSKATRKDLRRKFRAATASRDNAPVEPIEMQVVSDVTPYCDELYALYLQVYHRSPLHFEKLTKEYLCAVGRDMPDKARYFLWRRGGRIVAFSLCLINDDTVYDEYLGLDYAVALDLHLYHHTFRDIVTWAMARGYKWYVSSALNYDPKLHLKCELAPLDLYVTHTSPPINWLLRRVLRRLEPTRNDKTLRKFPNYADLWGQA